MGKSKLLSAYRRGRLSGAAARTGFLSANRCRMYCITIKNSRLQKIEEGYNVKNA